MSLYAQLHGLTRAVRAEQYPTDASQAQLEADIQAYADIVVEEEKESYQGETGALENTQTHAARVREQVVHAMHEFYECVDKGYKAICRALEAAGEEIPEVPDENLKIFEDADAFMNARLEGTPIYELLGYSFETLTRFYNALDTLFQQGDNEKVRDGFYFMITISPKTTEYWIALGLAEIKLKKYDKAEEAYLKALDLDPSNPNSYLGCLHAYEKQDKFGEAEALCDKGILYAQKQENAALEALLIDAKQELKSDSKQEF